MGKILQISVYVNDLPKEAKISKRAEVRRGPPPWRDICRDEVDGEYINRVQKENPKRGDMIVTGKRH